MTFSLPITFWPGNYNNTRKTCVWTARKTKLGKRGLDETGEQVFTIFNNEKRQFLVKTSHQVFAALERAGAFEPDRTYNFQTTLQTRYSHLIDKETETLKGYVTFARPPK